MKEIFNTAVARLTIAYVAGLALVCIFFSALLYQLASREIDQSTRRQVVGFRSIMGGNFVLDEGLNEMLRNKEASEARSRLKAQLLLANIAVVASGSVIAYAFAKKTLEPIEKNVKAQERFTSDASHELRTPLAVMRSEIEVALRDKELNLNDAKSLLESNLEEVNAMHAMTESLLRLARNKEIGVSKEVDSRKVIREVIERYASQAKKEQMTIKTKLKAYRLVVNPEALGQTISILIDNAIRYAGKKSTITITSSIENTAFVIAVRDNGVGIKAEYLGSIFDRFTREDQSRTHQGSYGHGLGLSIAKQLVDAMGGTIEVQSKPSEGATFRIIIPTGVES